MAETLTGQPPGPAVLVVDDTEGKLAALGSILEPLGCRVLTASSGIGALRRLLAEDVAVILLDVRMTDMDGFETASLIRQRPRFERTPIIFVTALGAAEADMARGYALGAVDFIFAPVDPDVLRNKVSVFLDLHDKTERVRLQADRLRTMERLEQRRRLEEAESGRRHAEARFATMLDIAGDSIVAVDRQGCVVLFNRAAERTFGRSAETVMGRSLDELIVDGSRQLRRAAPGEGPHADPLEVVARRAGGTKFPAEISVALMPDEGDEAYTLILRDVSERRQAEDEVRRLNVALGQRLRAGVDMVADVAASLDADEVLGRLLDRAAAVVSADHGTILHLDPSGEVVERAHELGHATPYPIGSRVAPEPLLAQALREQRPVLGSPFLRRMLPHSVDAWGAVPRHVAALALMTGDRARALLLVARSGDTPFVADDLEMLRMIGSVAVVALRNADLFSRAQASSRSKSEFLNLAAHELRTPLSVVRGYASMLSDGTFGEVPDSWRRPLEVIGSKLHDLNALVDDLLTAARAEGGQLTARRAHFDLREAARIAAERGEAGGTLRGASIRLEMDEEPVAVVGDLDHTVRIADNLIANALTYTRRTPRVVVSVLPGGELRVRDNGVGIPPALREAVFERFFRITDPMLGPLPGTGLGLYISRSLARAMDGDLTLRSSSPRGSVFALRLPAAPAAGERLTVLRGGRAAAPEREVEAASL